MSYRTLAARGPFCIYYVSIASSAARTAVGQAASTRGAGAVLWRVVKAHLDAASTVREYEHAERKVKRDSVALRERAHAARQAALLQLGLAHSDAVSMVECFDTGGKGALTFDEFTIMARQVGLHTFMQLRHGHR